jgi:hypothetical protein
MTQLPGCFPAFIDGPDILVPAFHGSMVTAFGGARDVITGADNGLTQSGIPTAQKVNGKVVDTFIVGCALPIRSIEHATACSPLAFKGPHLPWIKTVVRFWMGDEHEAIIGEQFIEVPLIDNGPDVSRFPNHIADLTPQAVVELLAKLGMQPMDFRTITDLFSMGLSYRVLDGARYAS